MASLCCVASGLDLRLMNWRYVYLHGHRSGHDPRGIEDYVVASLLIGPSLVAVWNNATLAKMARCVDKIAEPATTADPASGTPAAGAPGRAAVQGGRSLNVRPRTMNP